MKKSLSRRMLSMLIALVMICSILPLGTITSNAASSCTLSINMNLIRGVGKQTPNTVACGCFCMAYCRTILDKSVHNWYEYNYNGGTDQNNASAWWSKAGYNTTSKSSEQQVYKSAYDQINAGRPCVFHVKGRGSPYHYIVCVGYTNVVNENALSTSNFLILDVVNSFPYEIENMATVGYSLYDYEFIYTNSGNASSSVATTGVSINKTTDTIKPNESRSLTATVSPSNATNKTVTWTSSNTSVATVSNGTVTGVAPGYSIITAKASGGQTATCKVIVFGSDITPVATTTYNGHKYEVYDDTASWHDAKAFCEERGGHLAVIGDSAENAVIAKLLQSGAKTNYFIGATDEQTELTWKWINDEPFVYSNFAPGENSESTDNTDEDYLFIKRATGLWGDIRSYSGTPTDNGFVCEYDEIKYTELPAGANPNDYQLITEYRYSDKETTTSTSDNLAGWTKYDSTGSYSDWSANKTTYTKPTESDTLRIVNTATHYKYYHYWNYYSGTNCIDSISYGTNKGYHEIILSYQLSPVSMEDQGGRQAYGSYTCGTEGFNYWFYSGTVTQYTYQTRSSTVLNYFYRYGEWSPWTAAPVTESNDRRVETRQVYVLSDHTHQPSDWKNATAAPKLVSLVNAKGGLTIKWNALAGADGYYVYRKTGSEGWKRVANVTNALTYTDTKAAAGTKYTYTVKAYCGSTYSKYNTTGLSIVRLTNPAHKAANAASGIKVTWSKVAGAKGYNVYRKTGSGSYSRIGSTTSTSYLDTTAKAGTSYTYAVRAYNGTYLSSFSGVSVVRLANPAHRAANAASGIKVTWSKVAGAKGYNVYRKTGSGSYSRIGSTTSTSYLDTTTKAGTSYTYAVRAYNGTCLSSFSGVSVVRLATPSFSLAKASNGTKITVTKVTGAKGYYIYRKTGSGSYSRIATTTSLSYVDKTAKKGTAYTYAVRAYNGKALSAYNQRSITR